MTRRALRLGLLLTLALAARDGAACDCVAMGFAFQAETFDAPDRLLALVVGHEAVFAGTVAATDRPDPGTFGEARHTVRVERWWKGGAGDEVVVLDDGSNCSYAGGFVQGLDVLVFGARTPSGDIRTRMCLTAAPVVLGHVTEGWGAGYAMYGPVLVGLGGDLFARLDVAADRAATAFQEASMAVTGSPTTLTVVLTDALTGAPVDGAEVVVSPHWLGRGLTPPPPDDLESGDPSGPMSAQRSLRADGIGFSVRLAPGVYTVSAQAGALSGETGLIATGGERIVMIPLRRPAE